MFRLLLKLSPLSTYLGQIPFPQVSVAMAASLPQKPGMAGMPPQQPPHLPPGAASAQGQQPLPPQGALREISPVFLCRIGQETVQDIVTRTMEIFQITRATQVRGIAEMSYDCWLAVDNVFNEERRLV